MALQTEIDTLLAAALTQGVDITTVQVQVRQRYDDQNEADPTFSSALPLDDTGSPDWAYWIDTFLANPSVTTMAFELAWNRAWNGAQLAKLSATLFGGGNWELYMFELLRIMQRDNTALLKYSAKTKGLIGKANIA